MTPDRITVHVTAVPFGTVEGIRRFHVQERKWSDIGYHYVITNGNAGRGRDPKDAEDGAVHEGRPITRQGAHVRGYNEDNIGVVLVGRSGEITVQQFRALVELLLTLMETYNIPVKRVQGHGELDPHGKPLCPGFPMYFLRRMLQVEQRARALA